MFHMWELLPMRLAQLSGSREMQSCDLGTGPEMLQFMQACVTIDCLDRPPSRLHQPAQNSVFLVKLWQRLRHSGPSEFEAGMSVSGTSLVACTPMAQLRVTRLPGAGSRTSVPAVAL